MITSTGSNFGVTGIQIKDYQTDDMAILNAIFEVDPSNADYQACEVMEIYVPQLRLKRSLESTAFIAFEGPETSYCEFLTDSGCTVIKAWIKDANTICLEKLGIYDGKEKFKIYIQSLFVPSGKRVPFQKHTKTTFRFTSEQLSATWIVSDGVVEDNWMFIQVQFSGYIYEHQREPWFATISNMPEDIDCDVLIVGGSIWSDKGLGATFGHIQNGVLSMPKHASGWGSTGYEPFMYAFIVRDNQ